MTNAAYNRLNPSFPLSTFLLAVFLASPASAQAPLKLEWKGAQLTVIAEQVSLSQILREIARQTGMKIEGLQELQEPISAHFSGALLEEGLHNLLAGVDYAIQGDISSPERAQQARLVVFGHRSPMGGEVQGVAQARASPRGGPAVQNDQGNESAMVDQLAARRQEEETLVKNILNPDPSIQAEAFKALAATNPKRALEALTSEIKSGPSKVRLRALQLLDEFSQADPEAVSSALGMAVGDTDPTAKDFATQVLGRGGGSEAMALFREAFRDPDPAVRLMALESAAQRDGSQTLLRRALSDPDESVRARAAELLKATTSSRR